MDPVLVLVLASLAISIIMTILILLIKPPKQQQRSDAQNVAHSRIITVKLCGDKVTHAEYRDGDYVGKRVDDCVVIGIYRVGTESSAPR